METQIKKEENPLFGIARQKHNEHLETREFDFLNLSAANENTFILGFCAGVSHVSLIYDIQIEMLQNKIKGLQDIEVPTKIVLDEENAKTLHY